MTRAIQKELDKAEEYILNKLFGDINNPQLSEKIKFILIAKQINFDKFINSKINLFEDFSRDFMDKNGFYDGKRLTEVLVLKFPFLKGLELPDMKPIDLAKTLDNLIGFEAIGEFIQKF